MSRKPHSLFPRAPWWAGLILAVALPADAQVACANQNPLVPTSTQTADFIIHGDGTATHAPTGLMWMRCILGQNWTGATCTGSASEYTWQDALKAAQTVNSSSGHAGYTDWRLPNKNELASIIEERCWNPAINATVFPGTPSDGFWSSSTYAEDRYYAWFVNFNDGSVDPDYKTSSRSVRLVRGGQ